MSDDKKILFPIRPIDKSLRDQRGDARPGATMSKWNAIVDALSNSTASDKVTSTRTVPLTEFDLFLKSNSEAGPFTPTDYKDEITSQINMLNWHGDLGFSEDVEHCRYLENEHFRRIRVSTEGFFETRERVFLIYSIYDDILYENFNSMEEYQKKAYDLEMYFTDLDNKKTLLTTKYGSDGRLVSFMHRAVQFGVEGSKINGSINDMLFGYTFNRKGCFVIEDKDWNFKVSLPKKLNLVHLLRHSIGRVKEVRGETP